MAGLGGGGEGVCFKLGRGLKFEGGNEVVGGGEGDDHLIRG